MSDVEQAFQEYLKANPSAGGDLTFFRAGWEAARSNDKAALSLAGKFTKRANSENGVEVLVLFHDASLSYWALEAGGFVDFQLTWEQKARLISFVERLRFGIPERGKA